MKLLKEKFGVFIQLHILLLIYSIGGICSKLASKEDFFSLEFLCIYGILFLILVFYAIMWQQILKKMKLVTAYANKSVTIIWAMIWGVLVFKEELTIFNIVGTLIIILGIVLVVTGEVEK